MTEASDDIDLNVLPNDDSSTAAEKHENDASKFIDSGRSHARNGKYLEAIIDLKHATHLQSTNCEAFYYLGLVFLKQEQYKDASSALETAIQNSSTMSKENINHYYFKYAFACQNNNQLEEAVKYYTKFIEGEEKQSQYPGLLNRGICYDKLEQYPEALSDFNRALTLTNEEVKPYCLSCRARVKAKMKDQTGALKDYDEAVSHTTAFIEQISPPKKVYDSRTITLSSIKISDFSPLGILINALQKEDAGDNIRAMQNLNKLLDEPEELHKQIKMLEEKAKNESYRDKIQSITYNLMIANMAINTVDKHKKAMEQFSKNENLKLYYCTVYFKLEELFMACKAIASGKVKPMEGKLGDFAEIITLVGHPISLVPVVGEPINQVLQPVVTLLKEIDYQRQKNTMTKIAFLGSTLELWELSQQIAEKLTETYEPLLLELKELEDDPKSINKKQEKTDINCLTKASQSIFKFFKGTKQKLLKEAYVKQAQYIGEYAVALMLESLLQLESVDNAKTDEESTPTDDSSKSPEKKPIDDPKKLPEQKLVENEKQRKEQKSTNDSTKLLNQRLIEAVCSPSRDQDGKIKIVVSAFGDRQILTKTEGKTWTLDGFYHCCGIITGEKEHYVSPITILKLYPYRIGTKEEAERLEYKPQK
ncbi:unnamed protein product [Rotaria sp. Silwood2]|nr:unnamed protein product [Rotaria sp. Silwood2]